MDSIGSRDAIASKKIFLHFWAKNNLILYTGCPKIKLALGKCLEIATHGSKMCNLNVERDKLEPIQGRVNPILDG